MVEKAESQQDPEESKDFVSPLSDELLKVLLKDQEPNLGRHRGTVK